MEVDYIRRKPLITAPVEVEVFLGLQSAEFNASECGCVFVTLLYSGCSYMDTHERARSFYKLVRSRCEKEVVCQ